MMFNNNRHSHVWGENSKACFCLTCGQVVVKAQGKNRDMFAYSPECDVMFPDGDVAEDIEKQQKRSF